MQLGPAYGFFAEPSKSVIVVSANCLEEVHLLLDNMGVSVKRSHRLLGVVGSNSERMKFVENSIINGHGSISSVARVQRQDAYSAFTHSIQNKWLYLQRLVPDCSSHFSRLEDKITSSFLPYLFNGEVSSSERDIFLFPLGSGV